MISRPSQRAYLSRLSRGRTDQSFCPDAKSQEEKDAPTNTCLGPKVNQHTLFHPQDPSAKRQDDDSRFKENGRAWQTAHEKTRTPKPKPTTPQHAGLFSSAANVRGYNLYSRFRKIDQSELSCALARNREAG